MLFSKFFISILRFFFVKSYYVLRCLLSLCIVQNYLLRFELTTKISEDCPIQRANFLIIGCSFDTLVTAYTSDQFFFLGK